jgi:cytochrome c biogenesis protein
VGSIEMPEANRTLYVIGPASGTNDPLVPAGEMRVEIYRKDTGSLVATDNVSQGKPQEVGGLDVTFVRETRFTGLKVVKDPGVNIIWIASTLMIIGLVMLFYFPHRRLWALCKSRPDGTAEVRLGTTVQRDISLDQEFKRLRERVEKTLGAARGGGSSAGGGEHV